MYSPVASGVRLLHEGRVDTFAQFMNPGPYELVTIRWYAFNRLPKIAQFNQTLEQHLSAVDRIRPLLTKKVTEADKDALMGLLRSRIQLAKEEPHDFLIGPLDDIRDVVNRQIVSLDDPVATASAIALTPREDWPSMTLWAPDHDLAQALSTPSGRDTLCRIIRDSTQPVERRLGCARALSKVYADTLEDAWAQKTNANYGRDLLTLLNDTRKTPALTATLAHAINAIPESVSVESATPFCHEIRDGLPLLRSLYNSSTSYPEVRYELEVVIERMVNQAAYQALIPTGGPVISLMRPQSNTAYAHGTLSYVVEMRFTNPALQDQFFQNPVGASIVLKNAQTGQQFLLPFGSQTGAVMGNIHYCALQILLPTGIPTGSYLIYLQIERAGRIISKGHGAQVKIVPTYTPPPTENNLRHVLN